MIYGCYARGKGPFMDVLDVQDLQSFMMIYLFKWVILLWLQITRGYIILPVPVWDACNWESPTAAMWKRSSHATTSDVTAVWRGEDPTAGWAPPVPGHPSGRKAPAAPQNCRDFWCILLHSSGPEMKKDAKWPSQKPSKLVGSKHSKVIHMPYKGTPPWAFNGSHTSGCHGDHLLGWSPWPNTT